MQSWAYTPEPVSVSEVRTDTLRVLGLIGAFALLSADASAYCRRRVTLDPSAECGSTGAPLWWRYRCIGYHVNAKASIEMPLDDAINISQLSFSAWSEATCSDGNPSVLVSHLGTTNSEEIGYSKTGANENIIVFRDGRWPHDDVDNPLALTTFTYDKNTGEIVDADIEINSAEAKLIPEGKPGSDTYELRSILTHEAGHFLGLAHTPVTLATMFARYEPGTSGLSSLEADDMQAICSVYLRDYTRSTGLDGGTTPATAVCDPKASESPPAAPPATENCICNLQHSASNQSASWAIAAFGGLIAIRRRPRHLRLTQRKII